MALEGGVLKHVDSSDGLSSQCRDRSWIALCKAVSCLSQLPAAFFDNASRFFQSGVRLLSGYHPVAEAEDVMGKVFARVET